MILRYHDEQYNFSEVFDDLTGFYLRTSILDEHGKETSEEAFMRSFPSLLDIGVMGKCSSVNTCNVGCYQQGEGNKLGHNMPLGVFKKIMDEVSGKTFEIAMGGFGNPNDHPNFIEMVKYAREKSVVPNYTTSGITLTDEQINATKKYCGAVAVSWHREEYTIQSIKRFLSVGMKTNIHYVVGNDSIDEAISRLENNDFPEGINAVIFLLYKPVGKVKDGNVLKANDFRVKKFYELIESEHPFKCGLDSCHIPGVMNFTTKIVEESIAPCDAGRFSMYITPDGFALPCSFDTTKRKWAVDIKQSGIQQVWEGETFNKFREHHQKSCKGCKLVGSCYGGCPLMGNEINLCDKEERNYYHEDQERFYNK
jgi:radical SAM protein with 4Fe4S-binding SPASM domain